MKRDCRILLGALIFLFSPTASWANQCDKDGVLLTKDIKLEDYERLRDFGFRPIQFQGKPNGNPCVKQYLYVVDQKTNKLERFVLSTVKSSTVSTRKICNLGSRGTVLASESNSITIGEKTYCRIQKGHISDQSIGKFGTNSDYADLEYADQIRAQREAEMPQYGRDLRKFIDGKLSPSDLTDSINANR